MKRKGNTRSGSVVATTFYRGPGGVLSRQKTIPVNKNSISQIKRRGMFAGASMAWKKLSAGEQLAFHELAKRSPVVNSLGQSKVLSGQSFFVKKWMGKEWQTAASTADERAFASWLSESGFVSPSAFGTWLFGSDFVLQPEPVRGVLDSLVFEAQTGPGSDWVASSSVSIEDDGALLVSFEFGAFLSPLTVAVFNSSAVKLLEQTFYE